MIKVHPPSLIFLALSLVLGNIEAFITLKLRISHGRLFYNPPEEFGDPMLDLDQNDSLLANLKARQSELVISKSTEKWKKAGCKTTPRILLDDYLRRIDMDQYPIAVCGSKQGSLYLLDLEDCKVLSREPVIHDSTDEDKDELKALYGSFDGGGTVAVAIRKDLVVSAGREGGAIAWRVKDAASEEGAETSQYEKKFELLGRLEGVDETLLTCLRFDESGRLWVGGFDGIVRGFDCSDSEQKPTPFVTKDLGKGPILDMSVNGRMGCGACATAGSEGTVQLFSLYNGSLIDAATGVRARSILIVGDGGEEEGWSVICGSADGSLHKFHLCRGSNGIGEPFVFDSQQKLRTAHTGPVMCLASPFPGLFLSGAQDSTIKVWELSNSRLEHHQEGEESKDDPCSKKNSSGPRCLYALTRHKFWLGSVCTDGKRLICDGCDNIVFVRDFSGGTEIA